MQQWMAEVIVIQQFWLQESSVQLFWTPVTSVPSQTVQRPLGDLFLSAPLSSCQSAEGIVYGLQMLPYSISCLQEHHTCSNPISESHVYSHSDSTLF